MTQEEKAKRYDDALELARDYYKANLKLDKADENLVLEDIFPELAESEDEEIKKSLINFFDNANKCGENPMYEYGVYPEEILDWLEKQGEQNPTDKIEPKFHLYEWVVTDKNDVVQIKAVNNGYYTINNGMDFNMSYVDKCWHKWTIEEANDGDVVVDKSDGTIGIFQSIGHHPDGGSYNDPSYCFLHCRYDDGFFYADFEHGNTIDSDNLIPATKEQRDLLFKKMHEAGYVWDAEKKELKIKLKEPDVYEYELERIVDKLNEVIGKLGDIHQVLSKSFQLPYTPPQEPWYKKYGIEKVTPVTCETTNGFNKSEDNESK